MKNFLLDDEITSEVNLPEDLVCPLTKKLMFDPVVAPDGVTYEREAIERSYTQQKMQGTQLNFTKNGRRAVREYINENPKAIEALYLPVKSMINAVLDNNVNYITEHLDLEARLSGDSPRLLTTIITKQHKSPRLEEADFGKNIFYLACEHGSPEIVNLFLENIKKFPNQMVRLQNYNPSANDCLKHLNQALSDAITEGDPIKYSYCIKLGANVQTLTLTKPNLNISQRWLTMGRDYYYGINGKNKDYLSARICFENILMLDKSDESSESYRAHYYFGLMYHQGHGLPQSYEKAKEEYEKAKDGMEYAHHHLGDLYQEGLGTKKDLRLAAKHYYISSEAGYRASSSALEELLYSNPLVTMKDSYSISMMFMKGDGFESDYHEARKWLTQALKRGGVRRIFTAMGTYYEETPVHKNLFKAHEYYLKGLETGCPIARSKLNKLLIKAFDTENILLLFKMTNKDKTLIGKVNNNGNTFLHCAVLSGRYELAKFFVRKGFDVNRKNKNQESPLSLMLSKGENEYNDNMKSLLALMTYCSPTMLTNKAQSFSDNIRALRSKQVVGKNRSLRLSSNKPDDIAGILAAAICSSRNEKRYSVEVFKTLIKEMLNIKELKPLLKIAAYGVLGYHDLSSRNPAKLTIEIDPDREDTDYSTLGSYKPCYGLYYHQNQIYLGGNRNRLQDKNESLVKGTLIHEICHFVAEEVFKNECKPYSSNDVDNLIRFNKISKDLEKRKDKIDPVLSNTFSLYKPEKWHIELIVRAAQLIASTENGKTYDIPNRDCPELFSYYTEVFMPACELHLEKLRHKNSIVSTRGVLFQNKLRSEDGSDNLKISNNLR